MRRRRGRDLPRADLRRAHGGGVPVGNAAVAHRHREPRVPGAVRDGRDVRRRRTRRRRRGRGRLLGRARASCGSVVVTAVDGWPKDRVNRWIRYHSEISFALTTERTALESALIPVTAYILDRVRRVLPALPGDDRRDQPRRPRPEELGRAGHRFATQIDPVHLWARPELPADRAQGARDRRAGRLRTTTSAAWRSCSTSGTRAAGAYRFDDGTPPGVGRRRCRHAVPRAASTRSSRSAAPVDDGRLARVDAGSTRCSRRTCSCSGSTRAPATRTPVRTRSPTGGSLLLRAFNGLGVSHFPWSADGRERDAATTTCSARSCSTASTCASPTSARR